MDNSQLTIVEVLDKKLPLRFCRICNSAAALYTGVCNSHCRKATKTARITTFFQWWELQIPIFLHSRIRKFG